jgi:hypothetical protein
MGDHFAQGHWHNHRKAEEEARKKEIEDLRDRATAKGKAVGKPKPPEKPFIVSRPPWSSSLG